MPSLTLRRWLWALSVLAVVLGALAWRLAPERPLAPSSAVEHLRIALPDVPHAALLHIAAEQGYFAAEGLDLTIIPATHGKAAMELLRQGKADLAAMADVVFLLALSKGESLGLAANVLSTTGNDAVVARRDRGIAAPRDLPGKKIGVSFGTSGEYFLWAFLIRHQLAPESVTLVDLPPGQLVAALAAGRIDAMAIWAPILFDAQSALGENAVSFSEANIYTLNFSVVGQRDFLQAHPQAIEKLLRALLKAEQFNQEHPEAALAVVARRLQIDAGLLRSSWANFNFRVDLRQSLLITLEDQARWARARGHVADGPLPNLLPHLYLDALLAVRPERVGVVH